MAANTTPIFTKSPRISWGANITAANTAMDGTGTVTTVFTADATNGSFVDSLSVRALGTNVQTTIRVFVNNGSTNTTALNNVLREDRTLPASTASNNSSLAPMDIPLRLYLPAGYKINITIGTAVAAGYAVSAQGGDF